MPVENSPAIHELAADLDEFAPSTPGVSLRRCPAIDALCFGLGLRSRLAIHRSRVFKSDQLRIAKSLQNLPDARLLRGVTVHELGRENIRPRDGLAILKPRESEKDIADRGLEIRI